MLHRLSRTLLAFAIASSLAVGPLARPAAASTGSTWTMIEAAAALIGGIVLYNNYEHKKQAANTIVGYTANGGTVFGDGRIVMPNGQTFYPNAYGQYAWGQQAYYAPGATGYTYDPDRSGRYDRTHRHGWYGERYRDRDDNYDRDDQRSYVRASYARPGYVDRVRKGNNGRRRARRERRDSHDSHG